MALLSPNISRLVFGSDWGETDNSEGYTCDLPQTSVLKQGEIPLQTVQSLTDARSG